MSGPPCRYCGNPVQEITAAILYAHDDCVPDDELEPDTAMKDGKLQMELVDLDFVADMALQLQAGLKGDRQPDDWKKLDPVKYLPKYRGAVLRHLRAAHTQGAVDPDTGASHWAAVAVNAMICFWLERSGGKAEAAYAAEFAHEQLNLDTASGAGLDTLGAAAGVARHIQTDADYRDAIRAAIKDRGAIDCTQCTAGYGEPHMADCPTRAPDYARFDRQQQKRNS